MSVLYTVLSCVGVALIFAIAQRTQTWLRLRHIPGPFAAGVSELWLIRHTQGGRIHMDTAEACEKHGATEPPKIQIAIYDVDNCDRVTGASRPNELITGDPDILRKILAIRSAYQR